MKTKVIAYKVRILNEAKSDVKEARTYYQSILTALSKRFTDDFKNTINKIKNNPGTFGYRFN